MPNNQYTFKTDTARFMSYVSKGAPGECWIWNGTLRPDNYGRFKFRGRRMGAHNWAYEYFVGPIPEGMTIDHKCHKKELCQLGNLCPHRRCVNPDHLEPMSHAENVRRGNSGKLQSSRTHCPSGHEYTPENTFVVKLKRLKSDGSQAYGRMCRECGNIRRRQWYRDQVDHDVMAFKDRTHCPQGHPYDEANTILDKKGRRCRECKLSGLREYKKRAKIKQ